jgi:uncharacterized protein DUF4136
MLTDNIRAICRAPAFRAFALAGIASAVACSPSPSVASEAIDPGALTHFKTFTVTAPAPPVDRVAVGATNHKDQMGGAVMDMDPMLGTSLVGRAMRQDLTTAFTGRGYQSVDGTPDFQVAYYAGTGRVVDTRAYETGYHADGHSIATQTYEYPAGTIVVDVVDARSDSLVWRGTGVAEIPDRPDDYARAVRQTIDHVVGQFPKAQR